MRSQTDEHSDGRHRSEIHESARHRGNQRAGQLIDRKMGCRRGRKTGDGGDGQHPQELHGVGGQTVCPPPDPDDRKHQHTGGQPHAGRSEQHGLPMPVPIGHERVEVPLRFRRIDGCTDMARLK